VGWKEETGRPIAKKLVEIFGGTPQFRRHRDVPEEHSIDILSCADRPQEGLTSYSTLGLHIYPNLVDDADIRVELCGVAPTEAAAFGDVLATAAFCKIKDGWRCAPAIAYPDVIEMYKLSRTMRHICFAEPFQWEELQTVHLDGDVTVHWLMVVPISESEYVYMHEVGWDALEDLFVKKEIDYWDLNRAPVV
jgi:antitoxin YqcF